MLFRSWGAILAEPLPPGLYRVKLTKVRGMSGAVRDSEREIRLRPPPAPRDTTTKGRPSPTRPPASTTTPPAAPAAPVPGVTMPPRVP